MNSREMVKLELQHKEPDKVPIGIGESSLRGFQQLHIIV